MMRRMITLLAGAALMLGMFAGPALAARPADGFPNVSCLRSGVSTLQSTSETRQLRLDLAQGGLLGTVIADHLSPEADYPWC
jgi:hypothetical protein